MEDLLKTAWDEAGKSKDEPEAGPPLNLFSDAIGQIESGGRYHTVGPPDRHGDRPYGKHQVMGRNIPQWSEDALGERLTPQQFLSDPESQEEVFRHRFGQYVDKHGPEGAARAWFAGERGMNNLNAQDSLGTKVGRYGQRFMDNARALGYQDETGAAPLQNVEEPQDEFMKAAHALTGPPLQETQRVETVPPPDPMQQAFSIMNEGEDPLSQAAKMVQSEEAQSDVKEPPRTDGGDAGFWTTMGQATLKGLSGGWQETKQLANAIGQKLNGGAFFSDIPPPSMETNDTATRLLNEPWDANNVWDPRKWGVTAVHGITSSWPEFAMGSVGGAIGEYPGAVAGFALSTGALSLVPNYQQAKAQGMDDSTAISTAMKASGIDTAAAALMGIAPEAKILDALKRPISDAFLKLGIMNAAGYAGMWGHNAIIGKDTSTDDMMNTLVGTTALAGPFVGVHAYMNSRRIAPNMNVEATPDQVATAYHEVTQQAPVTHDPVIVRAAIIPEREEVSEYNKAYPQGLLPTFFSQVQSVIEEKGPERATAQQWLSTIRNAGGVKAEEIEALKIPQYLADKSDQVSKSDLLAHIEENYVTLRENIAELINVDPNRPMISRTDREPQYELHRTPGPIERYGELKFYFTPEVGKMYESPHFHGEELNLLAHSRYTARLDRDGARTLHIEEIQSDWHQAGRKAGYHTVDEPGVEDLTKRYDELAGQLRDKLSVWNRENPGASVSEQPIEIGQIRSEMGRVYSERERLLGYDDEGREVPKKVPDAPFKTSWPELAFKRLMRYAADNGYQRISWASGEHVIARSGGEVPPDMPRGWGTGLEQRQARGMREFYDKILPKIADSWAKRLGMDRGETRLRFDEGFSSPVRYVEVSPAVATRIRMGLPLFSEKPGVSVGVGERSMQALQRIPEFEKMGKVLDRFAKDMKIETPIKLEFVNMIRRDGLLHYGYVDNVDGSWRIRMSAEALRTPDAMWAKLAHEFGHIVFLEHFKKLPDQIAHYISRAFQKESEAGRLNNETFADLLRRRDNAITNYYDDPNNMKDATVPVLSMTPEQQRYWAGFEEWFAEQVAKWATTSEKPLSRLDKIFASLGKLVRDTIQRFRARSGLERAGLPVVEMKQWLDSLMHESAPFAADRIATAQFRTQRAAQRSLERDGTPEVQAVPLDMGSFGIRTALSKGMGSEVPEDAAATLAHVDRINFMYRWFVSLPQLAEVNAHIRPLQYYREGIGLFNTKLRQDMERPIATLNAWRRLGRAQSDAVAQLVQDWTNMTYRTPDEITKKVRRMPTEDEFKQLVAKYKVSDQGLGVFRMAVRDLDSRIEDMRRILTNRAMRIRDDIERDVKINSINSMIQEMKRAPYFPFFRKGRFTVTVYGADGEVKHLERAETLRQQKAAVERLKGVVGEGDKVLPGQWSKDVEPLFGLPPAMLDLISETLSLSEAQKAAIPHLKFDHSPEQNAFYRYSEGNFKPGDGTDFIRGYAAYWFHGSRNFARADWADRFRGWIQETRELRQTRTDATKLDQIANFMGKHLDYVLSPKPDFAALRGLIFNLRLGFSPTTATLYLTQTPLGTIPWLGAYFGDAKALAAIGKASANLHNYYKSKSLAAFTEPHLKGISEAMKQFVLDGGAAPELAGIAEGRNLNRNFGKNAATRAWVGYQEAAGTLLHLADSWNRRIAFDAGWNLAMENPNAKYISRAREANPMEYARLLSEGWSPQEASAYVVGKHTVESTHFVYQRSHRPQIMWGKASALFMFKFWQQNMLFTLWNYPSVAARSLLVMGAMGGLMGLPFAQDFNGILKAVGWKLFGKDFDLDREIRQFVVDHVGEPGKELADSLLHGLARNGMGIPAVMEALGHHVGFKSPYPNLDRSSAMGTGEVLPVNMGELLGPHKDVNSVIARESQNAAGAAFGFFYDVYKLLADSQLSWSDTKKWESVAPHWLGNLSKAYRWYSEGRERDRSGNTVIRFDPNDTQQMMEILARTAGYNPTRLTQHYDVRTAEREVEAYWDLRHEGLVRQYYETIRSRDKEGRDRVLKAIKEFNKQLPSEAKTKAISGDQLEQYVRKRVEQSQMIEKGLPTNKRNLPIERGIQRIYPGAEKVNSQNVR